MNFSVALIAKNEEKTLPRLLGSLSEFFQRGGKVLLLDTGSTDKTVEVAKQWGCEVHEVGAKFVKSINATTAKQINRTFCEVGEEAIVAIGDTLFDYSAARNYIAELSPTDMIAMPDCDEVYTKLDLDKLNAAIASGVEQLEYNFVFSHDENGNEAIKFLHCKFYNRKKLHWTGIIHEVLTGQANRQFFGEDVIKLEHWQNYETNRSGYLKGLALDCFLHPDNDRNSHYFGRELLWTGRPKSAIRELERHVNMNRWPAERAQSMIYIGDALLMLGRDVEALDWYHRSFLTEPNRREPLLRLADYFYKHNQPQQTAAYTAAALEIPLNNFYANQQAHYTYFPHELMYWAKWYLGDKEESKRHFDKALAECPTNSKFLHDVAYYYPLPKVSFVLPHMGKSKARIAGLNRCLTSIKNLNYPKELIETIVLEDTLENRLGVPKRVKEGVEKSTGAYIVYASNDIVFHPDSLMIALLELWADKERFLVAFDTGPVSPDEGNICEHFIFEKAFLDSIGGEIFDTDFHHVGVDNLLWAKCKKLHGAYRSHRAKVTHHHFSKGAPMDDVYKLGWSEVEHDRALLKEKLKTLEEVRV